MEMLQISALKHLILKPYMYVQRIVESKYC